MSREEESPIRDEKWIVREDKGLFNRLRGKVAVDRRLNLRLRTWIPFFPPNLVTGPPRYGLNGTVGKVLCGIILATTLCSFFFYKAHSQGLSNSSVG